MFRETGQAGALCDGRGSHFNKTHQFEGACPMALVSACRDGCAQRGHADGCRWPEYTLDGFRRALQVLQFRRRLNRYPWIFYRWLMDRQCSKPEMASCRLVDCRIRDI